VSAVSEDIRSRPAASDSPPAARLGRPRWRDARLLGGLLLVLLSVVLGARVLAAADDTVAVWSMTTDLAAGSTLQPDDLKAVQVRLGEVSAAYLGTSGRSPVGWIVTRPVTDGELLPLDAVAAPGSGPQLRSVTVPVERFHAPGDLGRGQRVDVYVTPEDGTTRQVLTSALVADVVADGGRLGPSGASTGVVLSVAPEQVAALVQAAQDGAIDLVRVPQGP
jgi:SAF domain